MADPAPPPPAGAPPRPSMDAGAWKDRKRELEALWSNAPTPTAADGGGDGGPAAPPPRHPPAASPAPLLAPAPTTRHEFARLVGVDAWIPPEALKPVKRLGSGSFATVELCDYRPSPSAPPTRVAVKRLRAGCALDAVDLAAEARLLAGLRHPNIVRFLGVGASPAHGRAGGGGATTTIRAPGSPRGGGAAAASSDPLRDDCCYLVQAYVGGGTLKKAVQSSMARPRGAPPPYTAADAAAWGADVAAGLAFLHGSNPVIIHRDLKLENVLLTKGGGSGGSADGGGTAASPPPPAPSPTTTTTAAADDRRVALLADFGLAASFVSPDLDTRRSALTSAPTAAWWRASSGGRRGSGGSSNSPPPCPDLGRPRVSAVAAQLARLAAGEAMDDARVSAAADALDAALSAWTDGPGAAARGNGSTTSAGGPPRPPAATRHPPSNRAVFAMTAKTGSYLYMAPEITLGSPYNQAADLFSLGVLLWELFSGKTVAAVILAATPPGADLANVAELYAHRVSRGFRPPIPPAWPEVLRSLVSACWAHAPDARPRAAAVAAALATLATSATLSAWQPAWAAGLPAAGEVAGGGNAPHGSTTGLPWCCCM